MLDASDAIRATERAVVEHDAAMRRALELAGDIARTEVARKPTFTPRTGELQKATQSRVVRTAGGKILRIYNTAEHAAAIERGARPHVIRAKPGGVLRFMTASGPVYRRAVNHPGNRPYWFLRRATGEAFVRLEVLLVREMARVAERFGSR